MGLTPLILAASVLAAASLTHSSCGASKSLLPDDRIAQVDMPGCQTDVILEFTP